MSTIIIMQMALEDWCTTEAMMREGGAFVHRLGYAARAADPHNLALIKATWSEYWEKYRELGAAYRTNEK